MNLQFTIYLQLFISYNYNYLSSVNSNKSRVNKALSLSQWICMYIVILHIHYYVFQLTQVCINKL